MRRLAFHAIEVLHSSALMYVIMRGDRKPVKVVYNGRYVYALLLVNCSDAVESWLMGTLHNNACYLLTFLLAIANLTN